MKLQSGSDGDGDVGGAVKKEAADAAVTPATTGAPGVVSSDPLPSAVESRVTEIRPLVVIVEGDSRGIQESIASDIKMLQKVFGMWADIFHVHHTRITGSEEFAKWLLRRPAKSVLVWYTGHGNNAGGRFSTFAGEAKRPISAKAVFDHVGRQKDLFIFVCDACNSIKVEPRVAEEEETAPLGEMMHDPFQYKGQLIVSSSDLGQASLATSLGSLFTLTFLKNFTGLWLEALLTTRQDILGKHTVFWDGTVEPVDDRHAAEMPDDIGALLPAISNEDDE